LVAGRPDLVEPYLQALGRELAQAETPREVDTLYFGGGTPTQLPAADLQRLLTLARTWFPTSENAEICVEANPADIDTPRCRVMQSAGVTRVSLGAQSFNKLKLAALERDHTAEDIARAVAMLRTFVRQLALDLIFGAPGEDLNVWRRDLDSALALEPDHLSTYGLTYERGAAFWSRRAKGVLQPVSEDLELAMYEAAIDRLTACGFEHYEVSNFALPGSRSRHNEVYWSGRGYYAAGPGAARLVGGLRETNHRSVTTYIKRIWAGQSAVAEREQLGAEDAARERLVFGLRRLEGIHVTNFQQRTGFAIDDLVGPELNRHLDAGLLMRQQGHLRLTRKGLLVSDSIWPDFLVR
jgi:oxygen-independent coproporphyrinogen-3 oxidase